MDIREARGELFRKENQLEYYLTKKQIAFNKTQPGAIRYKEDKIIESTVFDKFNHYMIKIEEYDKSIYELTEEILALQNYIFNEMKRIKEYDPLAEKIVRLRDGNEKIKKYSWKKISSVVNYSERQCQRIYNEFKGKCK